MDYLEPPARLALGWGFRYVRGVVRVRSRVLLALALVALPMATSGCQHKSKTPEEAFQRFASAVQAGDGAALFDALEGRFGNMVEMGIIDPLRVVRSALQNGASVAGLILTTNSLVAEEVTPWNKALMTEFGPLDEGIPQPSPDSSTPQSMGLGPSMG